MNFTSKLLIITGILSLTFGSVLLWQRHNPTRIAFDHIPQTSNSTKNEIPVHITIESVGISLPIVPSQINDNGEWDLTTSGVSYLTSSPLPGYTGNSILYGHNWKQLLGNLEKIHTGDIIEIVYNNKKRVIFTVTAYAIVTPDQSDILTDSNDTRITVYTCTGFLDRKRLVITAIPMEKTDSYTELTHLNK